MVVQYVDATSRSELTDPEYRCWMLQLFDSIAISSSADQRVDPQAHAGG